MCSLRPRRVVCLSCVAVASCQSWPTFVHMRTSFHVGSHLGSWQGSFLKSKPVPMRTDVFLTSEGLLPLTNTGIPASNKWISLRVRRSEGSAGLFSTRNYTIKKHLFDKDERRHLVLSAPLQNNCIAFTSSLLGAYTLCVSASLNLKQTV